MTGEACGGGGGAGGLRGNAMGIPDACMCRGTGGGGTSGAGDGIGGPDLCGGIFGTGSPLSEDPAEWAPDDRGLFRDAGM